MKYNFFLSFFSSSFLQWKFWISQDIVSKIYELLDAALTNVSRSFHNKLVFFFLYISYKKSKLYFLFIILSKFQISLLLIYNFYFITSFHSSSFLVCFPTLHWGNFVTALSTNCHCKNFLSRAASWPSSLLDDYIKEEWRSP